MCADSGWSYMQLFESTRSNSSWKWNWKINRMTIDFPSWIGYLQKTTTHECLSTFCFHTFAPQKSYLFARANGEPCSQMIFEQSGLDNGNVYGVSPSFLIRILHGLSNGSGFGPSSNLFSRILFNVSWNTYRQLISLISSSIYKHRFEWRHFFE